MALDRLRTARKFFKKKSPIFEAPIGLKFLVDEVMHLRRRIKFIERKLKIKGIK